MHLGSAVSGPLVKWNCHGRNMEPSCCPHSSQEGEREGWKDGGREGGTEGERENKGIHFSVKTRTK